VELRTRINIEKSSSKITYSDPVMFIGSCFASEIGSRMAEGRMQVMINPAGTVYNPVSVASTLNTIMSGEEFSKADLHCFDGTWLSFTHYMDFASEDPVKVLEKINTSSAEAAGFLQRAKFLFITFGTARVFRLKETGTIVSNCHKLPAGLFDRELLKADEILTLWNRQLDNISILYPGLKIIFTISPVRHWKDGAHGNQVSKSVLFLAIEELLAHPCKPMYFPAYELIIDELRDYRFYDDDMLHPSKVAVDYIWEAFSQCFMDPGTITVWNEAAKISKAVKHRITSESEIKIRDFAQNMLGKISKLEDQVPQIDLSNEIKYFRSLLA
jgi:hypothetical protein